MRHIRKVRRRTVRRSYLDEEPDTEFCDPVIRQAGKQPGSRTGREAGEQPEEEDGDEGPGGPGDRP